ncbi:TM2 domain-containing protein [Arsukibacterium indicum]|uniref:TM2 domain-containing protein n=1 Tax=Arsukibacterium indicum TaxID=2848612 RepID=A0ABS6MKB6_9GAMM|nr:TM2 domain-containing protein [Arsukibacterium indicum]MBV2129260.1 TM2 domain-containing protein [Arsukibacterium indicum]
MLNQQQVDDEEELLREQVAALPDEQRKVFYQQLKPLLRDPDTYATLNWCFLAGLHHFYLGLWGRGLANLLVFIVGAALLFTPMILVGIAMLVLISVIELWALFRAQIIIQHWNNQLIRRLLQRQLFSNDKP